MSPVARWETIYFKGIDPATKLSCLQKLSETSLWSGDQEIRIWRGFGLSPLEGITLTQIGGKWSAKYIKADNCCEILKVEVKEFSPPKSGWDALWKKLDETEILTLPDPAEEECPPTSFDGMSYVVEISKNNLYRTYRYDISSYKCRGVEKMKAIGKILADELYDGVEECKYAEWLPCVAKYGIENDL